MLRRSLRRRQPLAVPAASRLQHLSIRRSFAEDSTIPTPPKEPLPSTKASSEPNTSSTPPPPKPKKRRIPRIFFTTLLFTASAYGIAIYYSLVNDNFHDFFTEYVPLGEEAVLFFEEREFQRRFGEKTAEVGTTLQSKLFSGKDEGDGDKKVTVAGNSGVSARVTGAENRGKEEIPVESAAAKGGDRLGEKDRAVASRKGGADKGRKKEEKKSPTKSDGKRADEATPADNESAQPAPTRKSKPEPRPGSQPGRDTTGSLTPIDTLMLPNASDPTIQTTATLLNDLITALNSTPEAAKFCSAISKAKSDLHSLAETITSHRSSETRAVEDKLLQTQKDFDQGAQDLIARVQRDQHDQELRWREEYEAERERLASTYDDKLRAESDAAARVADQKLRNELLQQSIQLTDGFAQSVRDQVEQERGSRLARLNELSASVAELSDLTAKWGAVIDANLRTQHLLVAVEAVRTSLETPDHRPRPFVHELAAVKEVAPDSPVIAAAIASITPASYQKGIPTPAQLIDRFRRVADEVRKASLLPEGAGVASHAASAMLSRMLFRKEGWTATNGAASGPPAADDPTGKDTEAILSRTEMLLEEGDLDGAAREVNMLSGWPRVLSRDWLGEVRRVLEVRQAVEVMAAEARLQSLSMRS